LERRFVTGANFGAFIADFGRIKAGSENREFPFEEVLKTLQRRSRNETETEDSIDDEKGRVIPSSEARAVSGVVWFV